MNEWPMAIWASISAMTAALVLSFIMVLGSLASQSAQLQHDEDNAIAIIKEYRKYNQYDGQTVYPQDVITAIGLSGGRPEIWVDITPGPVDNYSWRWTASTPPGQFTTAHLTNLFPVTAVYQSELQRDLNGAIIRIRFRRL